MNKSENSHSDTEEDIKDSVDGPDTSSFTAFLYSLLASSESQNNSNLDEKVMSHEDEYKPSSEPMTTKDNAKKKSLFSRGKHSLGKALHQAAKIGSFRNQASKSSSDMAVDNEIIPKDSRDEGICMKTLSESQSVENISETSEPSLLLSEKTRSVLYSALPVVVQGRKWMLLYRLRTFFLLMLFVQFFLSFFEIFTLKLSTLFHYLSALGDMAYHFQHCTEEA